MSTGHYLAAKAKTWTPDVVISFDTETKETKEGTDLVLRPRCWDAVVRVRHDVYPELPRYRLVGGELMVELADMVLDVATHCKETWVFAHNLAFDLSVSALPWQIDQLGWSLDGCNLTGESTWWVFKKDGHKLVLTDSWSWTRSSLEEMAKDLRKRKRPLPANDDDMATWHARCRTDAKLLDESMSLLMDWWDTQQLGRWGVTGAGCGWSAMKAQIPAKSLVVGADDARTPYERSAIYGGMKQAWRVGEYKEHWTADYDFKDCYPRIAATRPLPCAAGKPFGPTPTDELAQPAGNYDVIASVLITTETPCAPCRIGDETVWPVGTFQTVLAGPELRHAIKHAQRVEILGGQRYRTSTALGNWARWLVGIRQPYRTDIPPLVKRVAKGWGRSVLGRFAGRTSRVTTTRPATSHGWSLSTGRNLTSGNQIDVLTMGGIEYTIERDVETDNGFPAVFAFVESYARVALWEMLNTRRPDRLLACNTDGWLEHRAVRVAAYNVPDVPYGHEVVRKGCWRVVTVLGPSHMIAPGERRLAGIPRAAGVDDDGVYSWHDWPSLRWQLERGSLGLYRRPVHDAVTVGNYVRRWVLTTGETVALDVKINDAGENEIRPWVETSGRRNADRLAAEQHEMLRELVGEYPPPLKILEPPYPRVPGRSLSEAKEMLAPMPVTQP